jgi:hypothetical protein
MEITVERTVMAYLEMPSPGGYLIDYICLFG